MRLDGEQNVSFSALTTTAFAKDLFAIGELSGQLWRARTRQDRLASMDLQLHVRTTELDAIVIIICQHDQRWEKMKNCAKWIETSQHSVKLKPESRKTPSSIISEQCSRRLVQQSSTQSKRLNEQTLPNTPAKKRVSSNQYTHTNANRPSKTTPSEAIGERQLATSKHIYVVFVYAANIITFDALYTVSFSLKHTLLQFKWIILMLSFAVDNQAKQ